MKFLNKISVGKIIESHWRTLVNNNTHKLEWDDILTFILLPIIIASVLIYFCVILSTSAVSIIITALSIFVGLLFNVIVLIFDIIDRDAKNSEKNEFLRQILSNISFAILVSLLTITFSLFCFSSECLIKIISSWIVYFLSSSFLFTVLMILKRIYALFNDEIINADKENKK